MTSDSEDDASIPVQTNATFNLSIPSSIVEPSVDTTAEELMVYFGKLYYISAYFVIWMCFQKCILLCHLAIYVITILFTFQSSRGDETSAAEDDASFAANNSFAIPEAIQEDSIRDNTLHDIPDYEEEEETQYEVVEAGTKRGKRKLVDKRGYEYTIKVTFV